MKIRGEVDEISIPIVEALPTTDRTSGIHLMAIHSVADERGGLMKKEKQKKVYG